MNRTLTTPYQKWTLQVYFWLFYFITHGTLLADVISNTGEIDFKVNISGQAQMNLSSDNLKLGKTGSEVHLQVSGNQGVDGRLRTNSLHLNGAMSYGVESVSSNLNLSGNSLVLADSSAGNLFLRLPDPSTVLHQLYKIKKITSENEVSIKTDGTIDEQQSLTLSEGTMSYVELISTGSQRWNILSTSGNTSTQDLEVASDNLVAYWRLDENDVSSQALDSSGRGFHGTYVGSMTNADVVESYYKKGLDFDGDNDYIEVPHNDAFGGNVSKNLTVSIRIKSDVTLTTDAEAHRCLEKGDDYFFLQGGSGTQGSGGMNFFIKTQGGGSGVAGINKILDAGKWYHLVGTYDGTYLKVYLDGVLSDNVELSGAITNSSDNLRFGADDSGFYFDGVMDEVRIYDRALTKEEVTELY